MLSTDPIADMLTRIRNAIMVNKHEVKLPHSKMKEATAKKLVEAGFLKSVDVDGEGYLKVITIQICDEGSNPAITEIDRVSRPGRRLYAKSHEIPSVKNGRGIVVVSTSKGLLTDREAKEQRLGGELICKVY